MGVSIKFKHFMVFGLGGPILNTLVWFFLRLHDQGKLGGDTEEVLTKWENGTKSFLCLFVEDRKVDVFVMQVPMLVILVFNTFFLIWVILIVILKLRQKAVTAADHDRRHWKAAKALIFVMPLLGVGHILTLVVKPTVGSIGVPLVVDVFDAVEAVIMSTQGFVISLPYCFLNSEVRGAVRSQWRRWRMVRTVGRKSTSLATNATFYSFQKNTVQV